MLLSLYRIILTGIPNTDTSQSVSGCCKSWQLTVATIVSRCFPSYFYILIILLSRCDDYICNQIFIVTAS